MMPEEPLCRTEICDSKQLKQIKRNNTMKTVKEVLNDATVKLEKSLGTLKTWFAASMHSAIIVLTGLMGVSFSAHAGTLEFDFGIIDCERMRSYYDNGTLCIEIASPYPVKVTVDPKRYTQDGKSCVWEVTPSSFYFTGVTVVCNATLTIDGYSEDTQKILFVPWQPIDVSNVVLYSPNSDKGWPYDPVYDDPIWGKTVRGSLSEDAANNEDKAPVGYYLNKPAVNVEIVAYKETWLSRTIEGAGSFVGSPTTNKGGNKVDAWIIRSQDEGDGYFVEVTAYGDRGDVDSAESQRVGIKREKYYTSTATERPGEEAVSMVAQVASESGTTLKIIETAVTLASLIPGSGVPAAAAGIALTWCPPVTAPWKDDHFAVVVNGEWEMKMFLWERDKYVNKSETTGIFSQETEKATFSVCYERIYNLGWLAYMVRNGMVPPVEGVGNSPVASEETMNGALDPAPLMAGFVSDYMSTTGVIPDPSGYGTGLPVTISSASYGPILGEDFFHERKVLPPLIASSWEMAQPNQSK